MKLKFTLIKSFFCLIFTLAFLHFSFGQNATNGGEVGYNQTIYQFEQPETIVNITDASGGNTNLDLEYIWYTAPVSGFPASWVIAPGITDENFYAPQNLSESTYFYRVARRNGFTQYQAGSNIVIYTVMPGNVDNGGIIGSEQSVMINEQPDTLFEIEPPSGGNPNADFEFEWVKFTLPNLEEPAEGIIDQPFYVPPPLMETTTFKRKARRTGFIAYANSNSVTIEVEPTSIENFEEGNIQLYPNPVTNYLQIVFEKNRSSDWLIEIFDLKGSLQKSIKLEDVQDNQTINLHDLAKGTYLIQLTDVENNKVERFKFLKK